MNEGNPAEQKANPQPKANQALPPDHPLLVAQGLLHQSFKRIPFGLIALVVLSLFITVVVGLTLKFTKPPEQSRFLPIRIEADANRPEIGAKQIEGRWTAKVGEKSMTLYFKDGFFEWVVRPNDKSLYARAFARGNYKIEKNILILGQRVDMGKPKPPENVPVEFLPLGFNNLNVIVEENEKLMLWFMPAAERRRQDTDFMRTFETDPEKPLVWVRMKSGQ